MLNFAGDFLSSVHNRIKILENHNFTVSTNGKYPAWKPDINEFTSKVLEVYKKINKFLPQKD